MAVAITIRKIKKYDITNNTTCFDILVLDKKKRIGCIIDKLGSFTVSKKYRTSLDIHSLKKSNQYLTLNVNKERFNYWLVRGAQFDKLDKQLLALLFKK